MQVDVIGLVRDRAQHGTLGLRRPVAEDAERDVGVRGHDQLVEHLGTAAGVVHGDLAATALDPAHRG